MANLNILNSISIDAQGSVSIVKQGSATTTQITGGAEPSLEDIDSIMLGNYSGSTMNYSVALVD